MSFIEGFANAYSQQYNKSQDRKAELENTKFKYGLDALMTKRETRTKKQEQETQWASQAKQLANGDADLAATFYKELSAKVDYETLQKRQAEGAYVKNDQYVAPDQTIKVPTGVAPKTVRYDEGMELGDKTTKRIAEIDKTLLEDTETNNEFSSAGDTSAYIYKPTNEFKVADLAQTKYDLDAAEQSKNPSAIAKARMAYQANLDAIQIKADAEAKAKGEQIAPMYSIANEKGQLSSQRFRGKKVVTAEGEELLINTVTGKPVELTPGSSLVQVSEDANKAWREASQKLDTRAVKYNAAAASYVTALNTNQSIREIIAQDPEVVTNVASLASLATGLQEEFKATLSMLDKQKATVESTSDPESLAVEAAKFEDGIKQLDEQIAVAPANQRIALNRAKYQALIASATYQFAAAMGVGGNDMSNKDVENFKKMLTGDTAPALLANLQQVEEQVTGTLMTAEKQLNDNSSESKWLAGEFGVKSIEGLSVPRIGDLIDSDATRMLYNERRKAVASRSGYAAQAADAASGMKAEAPTEQTAPPVAVKSKAEFDKLPVGSTFIAPDGTKRIKK